MCVSSWKKKSDVSCLWCTLSKASLFEPFLVKIQKLGYQQLTKIQKICIPPALQGYDILGSSKTGSGKTLCFVIPVLQKLYSHQWCLNDALFGIVLVPIRELGLQIYDFFNHFSSFAFLKILLLLGSFSKKKKKKLGQKKKKIKFTNISLTIATPGRLLQTIVDTSFFTVDALKIFVVDEADRILDAGFQTFFSTFLPFLPKKKQILLFSATLNSKLKNLARFNFRKPFFGSVREKKKKYKSAVISNPIFPEVSSNIFQYYTLVSPEKKIDRLFSFLKSHFHKKTIVFFSTKKQVQFFYLVFQKLRLNFNLFPIYGNLNQNKRIQNLIRFAKTKNGILFSTDLLARGIDFSSIDWILQMDCPPTIETYLHRIGRTGRLSEIGKTLLFLNYFEIRFLDIIQEHQIQISSIRFNQQQIFSIQERCSTMIKKNKTLFVLAHDAFFSYLRFVFFQTDKKTFAVEKIIWEEMAAAFGLVVPYRKEKEKKRKENQPPITYSYL